MLEWYHRKLRDMASPGVWSRASGLGEDGPASIPIPAGMAAPQANSEGDPYPIPDPPDASPAILNLADEMDPADRQLGEMLRSLELVDADTLTALLLEARRQRRSLRQVLLSGRGSGGAPLSLYQLALIEAGNLDGLVLGPLRVIDRLSSSAREGVYRVFDPRRGATCLLRHLADAEMQ